MSRLWQMGATTTCCEINFFKVSQYRHFFGGIPEHAGIIPGANERPIHLVLTFDLSDQRVSFKQPNITQLPLFYPFQYYHQSFSYRILNDSQIVLNDELIGEYHEDDPCEGYPQHFAKIPFALADPIEADELLATRRYKELWEDELDTASRNNSLLDGYDRISTVEGLMQGPPRTECNAPACGGRIMNILTVLRSDCVEGINLWGPDSAAADDVDIIYEYCPNCYLVHATNQIS